MHDFSTRAGHDRHHRRAGTAAAVVAVLLFVAIITILAPSIARSAQPPVLELTALPEASRFPGLEASASHDLAIQIVEPGNEGLELTARLTDDGGLIERALSWTIVSDSGETVFSGDAPEASIHVPPGDYSIRITYGAVTLNSSVTLLESNFVMVSYVLNAGGIRILPRIKDIGLPNTTPSSRIYAVDGTRRGKLVAMTQVPGEVIRVPQGDYRIESGFAFGNVLAAIDVRVQAGRMSAVEIDHRAGLARLAFVGAAGAAVTWSVADETGQKVAVTEGLSADLILAPGTYRAEAHVAGETLSATFAIAAGETRDIILGN